MAVVLSRSLRSREINRIETRQEKLWTRAIRKFFKDYAFEKADALVASGIDGLYLHEEEFQRELMAVMRPMYFTSAESLRFKTISDLEKILQGHGHTVVSSVNQNIDTKSLETFALSVWSWISVIALKPVVTISKTYFKDVRTVLQNGFVEGLGSEKIARNIRRVVGTRYPQWKAARIARTESGKAASFGAQAAAEEMSVDKVQEWVSRDIRVRFDHIVANGQTIPMGGLFTVGNVKMLRPKDPSAPIEQVVNCYCHIVYYPVVAGIILR